MLKAVFMAEMILIGQLAGLLPSRWWKRLTTACLLVTAVSLVIASFEPLRLAGVLPLAVPCGAVMAAMMLLRKFGVTASRQMQISSGVSKRRQWTLADLMLMTVFVASVMAVFRNGSFDDVRHLRSILWLCGVFSAFGIPMSLVTLWACFGRDPWRRVPVALDVVDDCLHAQSSGSKAFAVSGFGYCRRWLWPLPAVQKGNDGHEPLTTPELHGFPSRLTGGCGRGRRFTWMYDDQTMPEEPVPFDFAAESERCRHMSTPVKQEIRSGLSCSLTGERLPHAGSGRSS